MTNQDLSDAFSKYGTVTEATVVERYGFVHMDNRKDADIAIGRLNKSSLNGCLIDVQISTGGSRRGGGGGGGRDGGRSDGGDRFGQRGGDRGGGRDRRPDPYYDDYYDRRGGPYDRRPPPPPDHYYRDSRDRYGGRDDYYDRRAPPRDSYYDRGPPPRDDPYRYPPPRDSYAYDRPSGFDRSEYRDDPRDSARFPPPPMRREIDQRDDPYSRRESYASAPRSDFAQDDIYRRPMSEAADRRAMMKTESYDDSYSATARSSGMGSSSMYPPPSAASEYPGDKRPSPSHGYQSYGGSVPPAKRPYGGGADLDSYGY